MKDSAKILVCVGVSQKKYSNIILFIPNIWDYRQNQKLSIVLSHYFFYFFVEIFLLYDKLEHQPNQSQPILSICNTLDWLVLIGLPSSKFVFFSNSKL